jgi:hypothetical protein
MSELGLNGEEKKPLRIYLETPIEIHGIRIGHTKEGLEFLIEHWTNMPKKEKLSTADLQHLDRMITNFKQHLELYKSQEGK